LVDVPAGDEVGDYDGAHGCGFWWFLVGWRVGGRWEVERLLNLLRRGSRLLVKGGVD